VPTSTKDANGQTTTLAYTYPSGNPLVQSKLPGESGSFTNQSQTVSTCTDSSLVPCLQEARSTSLYSSAVTRTFYDAMGRATEVLAPASDSAHTILSFTTYNDAAHTVFTSQPTTIASTSSWVDPSTYTSVAGTTTTLDPAGRTKSVQDALGKSSTAAYGLGTQSGDSHTYVTVTSTDANGHVSVTYTDALGRTVYAQSDNALDLPTSVTVKDLAPQTGQGITTVTTTMQYDDLGRLTTLSDPDRGTHTYTYDADGHQVADVSGSRTLATSYDLLGRVGCLQDAVVTSEQHGACTSGANPFVKNTYDADPSGVTWSGTNYAVGRLTQSVAVNYLPSPDNTQGTVTQNMQYDARGQLITNRMSIATSGGSLAFPTLPQYQQALSYNDAGQLTTTQTTVGGQAGYTFTQAYDRTTSALKGLSNNSTGVATLATLSYNSQNLVGSINYLTTSGTALASNAFSYDEHNRLVWAANNGTIPSAGNGTCGSATMSSTLPMKIRILTKPAMQPLWEPALRCTREPRAVEPNGV
jgi:YD repeat-containing protein